MAEVIPFVSYWRKKIPQQHQQKSTEHSRLRKLSKSHKNVTTPPQDLGV